MSNIELKEATFLINNYEMAPLKFFYNGEEYELKISVRKLFVRIEYGWSYVFRWDDVDELNIELSSKKYGDIVLDDDEIYFIEDYIKPKLAGYILVGLEFDENAKDKIPSIVEQYIKRLNKGDKDV